MKFIDCLLSRTGKSSAGQVDPLDTCLKERVNSFVSSTPAKVIVVDPLPSVFVCSGLVQYFITKLM